MDVKRFYLGQPLAFDLGSSDYQWAQNLPAMSPP